MISQMEIDAFFGDKAKCCQVNELTNFLEKSYPKIINWEIYFYLQDSLNQCFRMADNEDKNIKLQSVYDDVYIKRRTCFLKLVGQQLDATHEQLSRALEELGDFFGHAKAREKDEEYGKTFSSLCEQYVNCFHDFYELVEVINTRYRNNMFLFFNERLIALLRQGLEDYRQDLLIGFIEKNFKNNFEILEALAIKIIITTNNCDIILYLITLLKSIRAVEVVGVKKINFLNNL